METKENNDKEGTKSKKDLRYWFNRIKKLFKVSDAEKQDDNPGEEDDKLKELFANIDDENIFQFYSVPEEIRPGFKYVIKDVILKGFYDGVTSVYSVPYIKMGSAKAKELYGVFVSHLNGEKERIGIREISQNNITAYQKKQMDLHHDYSKYLQHHHKFNERSNTIGEFILYLILFFLLLLADIPIGVELMKGLFRPDNAISFSNLFNIGKFAEVLRANWEALLAAIGISISTIYIKIFYDEYVGSKYGHLVVSKKRFEQLFGADKQSKDGLEDEQTLTPTEKTEIVKHNKEVKVIKVIILGFTIFALITVSFFRMYAYDVNDMNSEALSIPKPLLLITMMCLTLLFAIFSGVCLSISLTSLINYKRLKNSKQEAIILEQEYNEASEKLSLLKYEFKRVEEIFKNLISQADLEEAITEALNAYYNLAYNKGKLEPGHFMKGKDFLDRIAYAREEYIASKVNSFLMKIKPAV